MGISSYGEYDQPSVFVAKPQRPTTLDWSQLETRITEHLAGGGSGTTGDIAMAVLQRGQTIFDKLDVYETLHLMQMRGVIRRDGLDERFWRMQR